jgi:hypothetical protein
LLFLLSWLIWQIIKWKVIPVYKIVLFLYIRNDEHLFDCYISILENNLIEKKKNFWFSKGKTRIYFKQTNILNDNLCDVYSWHVIRYNIQRGRGNPPNFTRQDTSSTEGAWSASQQRSRNLASPNNVDDLFSETGVCVLLFLYCHWPIYYQIRFSLDLFRKV